MGQYLDIMLSNAKMTRGYGERLLVGIRPDQAARKPRFESPGAPTVVDTNHPTFVFGHLAVYPTRLVAMTGGDGSKIALPAEWEALFKAGVDCKDDPQGTTYPKWEEVLAAYTRGYDTAMAHLSGVRDDALLAPNPNEQMRERLPTVGAVVNFLLNNHQMMHFGQISAWRRCFGLPAAM